MPSDWGELVIDLSIEVSDDDQRSYSEEEIEDLAMSEVYLVEQKINRLLELLSYELQFLNLTAKRY